MVWDLLIKYETIQQYLPYEMELSGKPLKKPVQKQQNKKTNKLVLVFIVFAALIFTLVYKAVNTKFDLVSKDYYKDEWRYQEKIDGIHKANTLSSVAITQNNSTVTLALPKEMNGEKVAGEAWFYCKTKK